MQIIDTDAFLDMPLSSQLLYFHLVMRADDEGFISNPKRIQRLIGCHDDDLKILIAKRFILTFESGVVVIKHWLIHNTIRMDRFNETVYIDERNSLKIKDNKSYTENGNQMATIGKHKLSKVKLIKNSKTQKFSDQDKKNAELLASLIKENLPSFKKPNIEKWSEEINKIHRIDGYSYDQINYIINWCQKDDFWKSNILSTQKLRKQFLQLIAHAKRNIEPKENKNRMQLHDGSFAIKKFGEWYTEKHPDIKVDASYYPEIRDK